MGEQMSKMDEAAKTIPKYLFNKLIQNNKRLTPGEIFGAANLWSIILSYTNGHDPIILNEQRQQIIEKELNSGYKFNS